jgi:glycerophosphoryl diester phosphodiesterase
MTKDDFLVVRHEPMLSGTTISKIAEPTRKQTKNLDGKSIIDWFVSDFTLPEVRSYERSRHSLTATTINQYAIVTLKK